MYVKHMQNYCLLAGSTSNLGEIVNLHHIYLKPLTNIIIFFSLTSLIELYVISNE